MQYTVKLDRIQVQLGTDLSFAIPLNVKPVQNFAISLGFHFA